MRVGILARKSTDKQQSSVDRQIEDARRYAAKEGWIVAEACIFAVDEGVSGAVSDRPQVAALRAAARAKPKLIDGVVIQAPDRMGREMIDLLVLFRELSDAGLRVFAYQNGREYRVETAMEKFMLFAGCFGAEVERENLIGRCQEAAFYRARQGLCAGNRLYGYENVDVEIGGKHFRQRQISEAESRWVVWIHEHYDQAWGYDRIAAELNRLGVPSPRRSRKGPQEWRASAVREVILNDSYAGTLVFGERRRVIRGGKKVVVTTPERVERIAAPHLRVLDPDLWARNQARVESNKNGTRVTGNVPTGLLIGNLRCECGSRMYVLGGKHKTYGCGKRHQCGSSTCTNATRRPLDALDAALVAELLRVLDQPRLVTEVLAACDPGKPPVAEADERSALQARCSTLTKELANLTSAISTASNPAVITRLVTLLDEKQSALDAAEASLAKTEPPRAAPTLDPEALRARAHDKVVHLAEVLRRDIPAGREALRSVLAGPAEAVPIIVNGAPRFLVRARLSASAVLQENPTLKTNGDPNGI